jgi:hypothetical protein
VAERIVRTRVCIVGGGPAGLMLSHLVARVGSMTSLLPARPGAGSVEQKRQLGELEAVVNSRYGSGYLAEAYTGWPSTAAGRLEGAGG